MLRVAGVFGVWKANVPPVESSLSIGWKGNVPPQEKNRYTAGRRLCRQLLVRCFVASGKHEAAAEGAVDTP